MDPLPEDRTWLEAFRRGEREAMHRVYVTYAPRLFAFLRGGFGVDSQAERMHFHGIGDAAELEAVVQEVFSRALTERARLAYDGLRPYAPYLLTIAKNHVLDELRRVPTRRETAVGGTAELEQVATTEAMEAEGALDAQRLGDIVTRFFGALDADEARYLSLRFYDDDSVLAAAKKVGISRMRARWLELKLLSRLKRHLTKAGVVPGASRRLGQKGVS